MPPRKVKRPEKPVLLIAEAAEFLGVSQNTMRRWDASGRFLARRHPVNGYRLYDADALVQLWTEIMTGSRAA